MIGTAKEDYEEETPTLRQGFTAEQLVTWSQNLTPSQANWAVTTDAASRLLPAGEHSPGFYPPGFLSAAGVRGKHIFWSLAARPLGVITKQA